MQIISAIVQRTVCIMSRAEYKSYFGREHVSKVKLPQLTILSEKNEEEVFVFANDARWMG